MLTRYGDWTELLWNISNRLLYNTSLHRESYDTENLPGKFKMLHLHTVFLWENALQCEYSMTL